LNLTISPFFVLSEPLSTKETLSPIENSSSFSSFCFFAGFSSLTFFFLLGCCFVLTLGSFALIDFGFSIS